jgi:hypothetical protein
MLLWESVRVRGLVMNDILAWVQQRVAGPGAVGAGVAGAGALAGSVAAPAAGAPQAGPVNAVVEFSEAYLSGAEGEPEGEAHLAGAGVAGAVAVRRR